MRKFVLFLFMAFLFSSSYGQVKKVSFEDLENRISNPKNDTIYVVNFWATWCAPCVKELPNFKEVQDSLETPNVKFVFVSLDFPGKEERVGSMFDKQKLQGEVLMLTDTDANEWIGKVNEEWQGNIPVTLFANPSKDQKYFHEGTIESEEIKQKIHTLK